MIFTALTRAVKNLWSYGISYILNYDAIDSHWKVVANEKVGFQNMRQYRHLLQIHQTIEMLYIILWIWRCMYYIWNPCFYKLFLSSVTSFLPSHYPLPPFLFPLHGNRYNFKPRPSFFAQYNLNPHLTRPIRLTWIHLGVFPDISVTVHNVRPIEDLFLLSRTISVRTRNVRPIGVSRTIC